MPRFSGWSTAALSAALVTLAACSRSALAIPAARQADVAAGVGGESASTGAGAGGSGGELVDAGPDVDDAEPPPIPEFVYVATGTELYELDIDALSLDALGPFSGCDGSIIDIAVDRENRMFATTTTGFAAVEAATGVCTMVAYGAYPNSLVTVPKGTVDPNDEALVGYVGSTYVRIDKVSGDVTIIGNLDGGDLVSSGDIAVLPDGRSYLSVKQGGCSDCLVEVDPATGAMLNMIGPIGYAGVYGLASSKGMGFGFNSSGLAFTIDLLTGIGTPISIGGTPPDVHYNGAASLPAKNGL